MLDREPESTGTMPAFRRHRALPALLIVVSVVVVLVQIFFDTIPLPATLPGDTHIKRENTEFSFPIATSWVLI